MAYHSTVVLGPAKASKAFVVLSMIDAIGTKYQIVRSHPTAEPATASCLLKIVPFGPWPAATSLSSSR